MSLCSCNPADITLNLNVDALRDAPNIHFAVEEAMDADTGDFERQSYVWVD